MKKFIALLLACFLMVPMASAAIPVDYVDEVMISDEYNTAVDVMTAIGVFNGHNGYISPKDTLTRAEAAKVITYITITKTNADKLGTGTAPFTDVPADHWAAGSIAYCKSLDIVSGKGNDMFDPQGKLTGYEFAKMLLVILGYNADNYKGSTWDMNVNLDAINAGLIGDLKINFGANILREEAIQMAFNALSCECVQYTGGSSITIGNVVISSGGTTVKTGVTLAEKLYPSLHVTDIYRDEFGYNVKNWMYNNEEIAIDSAYSIISTSNKLDSITEKDIYKIFKAEGEFAVYVNGKETDSVTVDKDSTFKPFAAYAGASVNFIENTDASKEIVIFLPEVDKVIEVVAAAGETDRKVKLESGREIVTNNYIKDQYVLVYDNGEKIIKHEAAMTIFGTATGYSYNSTLYFDNISYPIAGNKVATVAIPTFGNKYTAVLVNGYIVDIIADTGVKVAKQYVYVYGGGQLVNVYGQPGDCEALVFDMNGVTAKMKTDMVYSIGLYEVGAKNANGAYALTAITANKGGFTKPASAVAVNTITDGKAYFTANTRVLTISKDNNKAMITTIPAVETVYNENTWVITSLNTKANVYEIELIVTVGEATSIVTTNDLYYSVGSEIGQTYIAGKTYSIYNVYEVVTGVKKTVITEGALTAGFKYLNEVNAAGAYRFRDAVIETYELNNVSHYGYLFSCDGIEDADASKALIVNTTDKVVNYNKIVSGELKGYVIANEDKSIIKVFVIVD